MIIGIEAAHGAREHRTGVEEYCYRIIQEFKTIIPSNVRVILYSNSPLTGPLSELPPGWENRVLGWPFKKGWSQVRLALELWRHPPDVFFAPGQLVPVLCPRRTVTTIHDSAFKALPEVYARFSRWYLLLMNRIIFKKSAQLITTSEFNVQELKRLYRGIDLPPVFAIPLGYNNELFKPVSPNDNKIQAVLAHYGVTGPFFISIGRLERKKNTAGIIQAFTVFKEIYGSDPRVAAHKLVLIGSPGVGYEQVSAALAASPCQADIIRPGYVASADLPYLLTAATGFVFPSLYEGFGIPVLEAMAMGCPTIISDAGSLPEVAGDAGVLLATSDSEALPAALSRLVADTEYRLRKSQAGLNRVRNFSWQDTAKKTWKVISHLA